MEPELPCPWCDAPLEGEKCAACGNAPIVCDKFRVTKVLGRGGMGVVYAAERVGPHKKHDHTPSTVAVKIIKPPTDDDWTAWELFERSSKVLQGLHHPRLPKVHAFERTDRGRLLLVREAFDGGTLQERITDDDRVEPRRLRAMLDEMLDLLEYLQGLVPPVIHRDIKPSNVMFRTKGDWDPVLVDFDTIVSRRSGLTIVGTPGYAAPEQFAGEATSASDVYGLGATMLFVATHTDADELPREHGRFVLKGLLPSLDEKLVTVLEKMVEPDVAKRYASAHDVKRDLARPAPTKAAPTKPAPAAPASHDPHAEQLRKHRWWPWLLVAPAGFGLWALGRHRPRSSDPSALVVPAVASPAAATTVDNAGQERACENGDRDACFDVAWRFDEGNDGVAKDYAVAAKYYERGCNLGNPDACNNLGVDYENGYGVTRSLPRARSLYGQGCDGKNARGCRNLALLYQHGGDGGIPHDLGKALALFTRGCDLEDGTSCNNLGWMYEDGQGTPKDLKKAANLYGLACDHGFLYGCRNSGIAYETADGVERDDRRAVALFKRACGDDEKSGCLELGRMTRDGRGTEADAKRAKQYFKTACDDGQREACDELKKARK
ncbi:MAG TPA: serine/threonine-protein kinase [Polyangiaceae bacterium]